MMSLSPHTPSPSPARDHEARRVFRTLRLSASTPLSPSLCSPSSPPHSPFPLSSLTDDDLPSLSAALDGDFDEELYSSPPSSPKATDDCKASPPSASSSASHRSPASFLSSFPSLPGPSTPFTPAPAPSPSTPSSPATLHSRLLLTEHRLRLTSHHLHLAAHAGQSLLRQADEAEATERSLRDSLAQSDAALSSLRLDLDRHRDERLALIAQVTASHARADALQLRADEAEAALASLRATVDRDRERARTLPPDPHTTADTSALHTLTAALESQVKTLTERLQAAVATAEEERRRREEAEGDVREWETAVDERDAALCQLREAHREEVAELQYRIDSLQVDLPMSPPVVGERGGFTPVMDDEEMDVWTRDDEAHEAAVSGMKVKEAGRNKRLSTLPFTSLLAELETELTEEVAARLPRDPADAPASIPAESSQVETIEAQRKEEIQRQDEAGEAEKENHAAAPAQRPAPAPATRSYFSWLTGKPAAAAAQAGAAKASPSVTTFAAASSFPAPSSFPLPVPKAPSPKRSASKGEGGSADVLREYFHLATLSVKLSAVDTGNIAACNVNVGELYEKAIAEDVPFHLWHAWVGKLLGDMKWRINLEKDKDKVGELGETVMYAGRGSSVKVRHRPSLATCAHRGVVTSKRPAEKGRVVQV